MLQAVGQISNSLFIPIYTSLFHRFFLFLFSPREVKELPEHFKCFFASTEAKKSDGRIVEVFVFSTFWRETTNLQKKSNFYQLYTSFWTKDAFETERTNAKSKRSVLLILGR